MTSSLRKKAARSAEEAASNLERAHVGVRRAGWAETSASLNEMHPLQGEMSALPVLQPFARSAPAQQASFLQPITLPARGGCSVCRACHYSYLTVLQAL